MSGRKRALLRMNERDRKKLKNIESRLGVVDVNVNAFKAKIDEIKADISKQEDSKKFEQDQQLILNITHLDGRIQEIESATQLALSDQTDNLNQLMQDSSIIIQDIRNSIQYQSTSLINYVNQFIQDFDSQIYDSQAKYDQILQKNDRQQQLAWQNLSYAEEVYTHLINLISNERNLSGSINQIGLKISTGWMNYQNESFQAALSMAQQSVLEAIDLRFKLEEARLIRENLLFQALDESSRLLDLAIDCQQVRAIDLEGNLLPTIINVDYWNNGQLTKGTQTLESIRTQLARDEQVFDEIVLTELITEILPSWEQALHDYVAKARIDVIAAQTRYEVAKTVVNALSEQGFELETGSFEEGDMRMPYHVMLGNLEGSQVHISVAPTDENPLNYFLDIDSYDSEIRTETELRYRAKELLGSMESAGLKVGQVYQSDDTHHKSIKEQPSNSYSVRSEKYRNRNSDNS